MTLYQCLLQKNRWYGSGRTIPIRGIVVHSSGANNPDLKRYVQPYNGQTDGMAELLPTWKKMGYWDILRLLGENRNHNDWNRAEQNYGMHAFVGKIADGRVAAVQTLPWDSFLWGCGSGRNGSYNSTHIQFEICEDTTDKAYTVKSYKVAAELCAHLCKTFGLDVSTITSHYEAGKTGFGSTHVDPSHWWSLYGLTMDGFRRDVQNLLDGKDLEVEELRYQKLEDVPQWAKATVQKLLDKDILHGDGEGLGLTNDMVRMLVLLDRASVFG